MGLVNTLQNLLGGETETDMTEFVCQECGKTYVMSRTTCGECGSENIVAKE